MDDWMCFRTPNPILARMRMRNQTGSKFRDVICRHSRWLRIPDSRGRIPMHYAAKWDQIYAIDTMVRYRCPVDVPDNQGRTPLHLAAKAGAYNSIWTLSRYTRATNSVDHFGMTPLHLAVQAGEVETVESLLELPGIRLDIVPNPIELAQTRYRKTKRKKYLKIIELLNAGPITKFKIRKTQD